MSLSQEQVVDHLGSLTVLEVIDLTKTLEDKWGVKASPIPVPGIIHGPGHDDIVEMEKQTEFALTLVEAGARKIEVIKSLRDILGLGLAEAKAFVEAAPKLIREGVSKEDTDTIRTRLEAAGAKIEVK